MDSSVSVIIPTYNQARYLEAAVSSALAQTHREVEVLVVDDGSTDDTRSVIDRVASRVRVFRTANRGMGRARNLGLEAATGELVAFLDSDDAWLPEYLGTMVEALRASPRAVAAFAGWRYVDSAGAPLPQAVIPFGGRRERLEAELCWRNPLVPSGAVARAASLQAVGGFDPDLEACADWDLWLRLSARGELRIVPRILVEYRIHGANASDHVERQEAMRRRIHQKHLGRLDGAPAEWPLALRKAVAETSLITALARFRREQTEEGIAAVLEAVGVWPELADDEAFYWELLCAYQQRGYRGRAEPSELARGERLLERVLLEELRDLGERPSLQRWGRASLVLARLTSRSGDRAGTRSQVRRALRHAPWRAKGAALRTLLAATLPSSCVRLVRAARARLRSRRELAT